MKNIRNTRPLAFFVFIVLFLSGCSEKMPGSPSRYGPQSSVRGQENSGYKVPDVSRDLDLSQYLEKPCSLVSSDLLKSLEYSTVGLEDAAGESSSVKYTGPGCGWDSVAPRSAASAALVIQTGNQKRGLGGLRGLHQAYQRGQYQYWDPIVVLGYPAAFYDLADERSVGRCGIGVGVADDLTFTVNAGPYPDDPGQGCVAAERIAKDVIRTLIEGA